MASIYLSKVTASLPMSAILPPNEPKWVKLMISDTLAGTGPSVTPKPQRDPALWSLAQSLESTFLAEMLSHTDVETGSSFGGGIGENQFTSFLTKAHANAITEHGGIGLAQSIYESLARGARAK